VKDRGETRFKIDDTVGGEIPGLFVGDAFEGVLSLHHGDGVDEAFEIFGEAALVGSLVEPVREGFRVLGGETGVAFGTGEVDDGFGAEDAVEVFMEEDLGETFQEGMLEGHVGLPGSGRGVKRRTAKDNAEAQSLLSRAEKDRYPSPRVFFVRVANKGLRLDAASRWSRKSVKDGESTGED
jgi:hypothetical protein